MNSSSKSNIVLHDLVLIGGGHAHVHVLKMLGMQPLEHVRITLITRDVMTPYSGMIPGYIAGHYTTEQCHIDLLRLSVFCNARLIHGQVQHIDCAAKSIYCDGGRPPLHYDTLSIDIGIVPRPIPWMENQPSITPVKPIDRFAARWNRVQEKVMSLVGSSSGERKFSEIPFIIAIVGGGAGGVEVALAIRHRLSNPFVQVVVINRGERLMTSHGRVVQDLMAQELSSRGIEAFCSADLKSAETVDNQHFLVASDGRRFRFDEAFWCTQAVGQSWLQSSGLLLTEDHFIQVNSTLESLNQRGVFAAGDCCHNVDHPRPKAGVFAVRAGAPLLANIRRCVQRQFPLESWNPQTEFLGIIGLGDRNAIASKAGLALIGPHLWQLKEKIDVEWMRQYEELPVMSATSVAASKQITSLNNGPPLDNEIAHLLSKASMRCAGCGSKVGASVISRALKRLSELLPAAPQGEYLVASIGDDAAVTRLPPTVTNNLSNALLVQTVDSFRAFTSDAFLFGKIAALHALSDLHAMNAVPFTALASVTIPYGSESRVEEELLELLAGVKTVLDKEGAALVGGHTSEGSELSLGLSVTGFVSSPSEVLFKGPIPRHSAIILTKPLGVGVLLAAAMPNRNLVNAWDLQKCYNSMLQSNGPAINALKGHHIQACTDVTGFGFMGHLTEMVRHQRDGIKDSAKVRIRQSAVPLLSGALEASSKGVFSSIFSSNLRASQAIINLHDEETKQHQVYPLLFDPQTSGGLLIAVPMEEAEEVIKKLKDAGYDHASVVGESLSPEEEQAILNQVDSSDDADNAVILLTIN